MFTHTVPGTYSVLNQVDKSILALDASTEVCSVALQHNGCVTQRACELARSHSKVLLPMVDELLAEASLTLKGLDAIVVTRGPGSFTGIRISIGIAQGLSYGAGIPLVGVSSLAALAQGAFAKYSDHNAIYVPAFDARMGEVYWASYRIVDGILICSHAPSVSAPEQLYAYVQEQGCNGTIVGGGHGWSLDGSAVAQPQIMDAALLPDAQNMFSLSREEGLDIIGGDKLNAAALLDLSDIQPMYLRNEVTWEKRKRIRSGEALSTPSSGKS